MKDATLALDRRDVLSVERLSRGRTIPAVRDWIMRTLDVYRERLELRDMDERLLRDMGLTREQADREASRPFWDHPAR